MYVRVLDTKTFLASIEHEKGVLVRLKGVDRIPMNSDREKFKVASVARNMPRTSNEND